MIAFCVFLEEFQAGHAVQLCHEAGEFVAAAEDSVELVVTEADEAVVLDGATVVDLVDIGPHAGTEAHMAGLAGGVELTAGKVEGAKHLAGLADGVNFTVAGGIIGEEHLVVPAGNHFAVLDDNGTERPAVMVADALPGLVNGHLHELVFCLHN